MILDAFHRLSNAQALTSVATTPSTNVVDLDVARDLGAPDPKALEISAFVTTAFTSGGAGTLQILFQGSVDNSAWTTYASTPVYALATLAAGAQLANFGIPGVPAGVALPRYWRLAYVVAGAAMTGGAVTADLVVNRPMPRLYPAGINISN